MIPTLTSLGAVLGTAPILNGVRPVAPQSEPKDYSGLYLPITALTLGAIALILALMWWGWRSRLRRQSSIPAPVPAPADVYEAEPAAAAEGMLVGTVAGRESRFDRVAVHGLGVRSSARLEVHRAGGHAGVLVLRPRVADLYIPAADLRLTGTGAGMAGKFVEPDGLILVTWMLGGHEVTSGFRPRDPLERTVLLEALQSLIREDRTASASPAADRAAEGENR